MTFHSHRLQTRSRRHALALLSTAELLWELVDLARAGDDARAELREECRDPAGVVSMTIRADWTHLGPIDVAVELHPGTVRGYAGKANTLQLVPRWASFQRTRTMYAYRSGAWQILPPPPARRRYRR